MLQATEGVLHRSLEEINPLISNDRDTGNGYFLSCRSYPSGDAEVVAIRLSHEDSLKRGGGAKRKNKERDDMDPGTISRSARRAKTTVRRKILTFQADRLMTLTFRENVTDFDDAWNRFNYFRQLMRKKFPRFQYVCVPELQKRGAIHFHLAVRGFYHANTVRKLWRRACPNNQGNIDITSPKKIGLHEWNPAAIAGYLSKYITKDVDHSEFNRRRYSTGGGIEIPPALNGWLSISFDKGHTDNILKEVLSVLSPKQIRTVWESEHWLGITYFST